MEPLPPQSAAVPVPATMRVWTCRRYGGPEVLACGTRPVPEPRAGGVLVRIVATTVSSGDVRLRAMDLPRGFGAIGRLMFGLRRPRQPIFGTEFSGVVAKVGPGVTAWRPGEAVVGFPGGAMGSHAEYRSMPPGKPLVRKPAQLGFAAAAGLCFGGTTALHYLRRAGLEAGERVLVLGAAGAVGCAMVQLARQRGAHVTAATSPGNFDLVRSWGADAVVDCRNGDFAAAGSRYDIVADAVGASTFARCHPLLNEHGRYLAVAADLPGMLVRPVGTKRSLAGPAAERMEDVQELADLAAAGALQPWVDRIYPFEQLPAAHAQVSTGRKRGSVVVAVTPEP